MRRRLRTAMASVALAMLATFASGALVACGGAAPKPKKVAVEDASPDVADEVRGVVQEAYGSLGHGNREGILPLLADQVYALGPGAADLVEARSDVVVALAPMFPADKKHRLVSHALRAVVSPGGKSAYVTDQLDVDGVAYVAGAVMEQQGDVWVAAAVDVARVLAPARQSTDALPPLVAKVDPAARGAVDLFTRAVARPALFLDQLADGPDVVAIGPGPKDLLRGGAAIHKAWKKSLKLHATLSLAGGARAGATPDGQLVWIHANLERATDDEAAPRRAFFVYALQGGEWRLIAAQESALVKGSGPTGK